MKHAVRIVAVWGWECTQERTKCCMWAPYRGAVKSLAGPTSRCILFDGENISFDASLVICINSTNISPIIIINGIWKSKSFVAVACFLPGRAYPGIANVALASRTAVIFKSHWGCWCEELSRMLEEGVWLHANRRCWGLKIFCRGTFHMHRIW